MMKYLIILFSLLFYSCEAEEPKVTDDPPEVEEPQPLEIGYSVPVTRITAEKMAHAYESGIRHVEASGMNTFFDKEGMYSKTDEEVKQIMLDAKAAADAAGINIWSVHMPFSQAMDLSTIVEEDRKKVVQGHSRLLKHLEILQPEIILFHPSYYLDPPGQRDLRKSQLITSALELDVAVRDIGATMVLENMLGPKLMKGDRERPLMRTVAEVSEIFNRLPKSIGLAVDMNHIKNPEIMVRKMGDRLKSVHIADGTGKAENHYFPCSGEGENNWVEILAALEDVKYTGPFVFESAYDDETDIVDCYLKNLYPKYIKSLP